MDVEKQVDWLTKPPDEATTDQNSRLNLLIVNRTRQLVVMNVAVAVIQSCYDFKFDIE